ncbi:MAG: hypothetical protein DRN66_00850 [Candidatus Nanohalarchaeota archaeon]|nr:MAG: hypothetical protein DRN66_00850 [Candidatus Nanohaloarchaeota archaeon]
MEIKKMTEDVFDTLNKYIQTLSSIEKRHFKEKIEQINSKYKSLIELKKTKNSTQEVDPMFFCFEDLPPTGKEYWFMKFASTEPEDKRQLLVMFGDGFGTTKINKKKVKCRKHKGRNGYMTAWCYDDKKDLILDGKSSISMNPDNIMVSNEQGKINYNGKFPDYSLNISKKNKEIADLKITRPENNSESFEFSSHFKSFAGFALINLYFDFTGMLNGKKFTGKCYVQKVIVVGPFVPWYWGRIVFSNGSIISYYEPRIELSVFNYKLSSVLTFYDNQKDKKYIFKDLTIKKFGKNSPRWIITADKGKFFISLKSYSSHKFIFEKIGSFTYIEYLSEITDISIEDCDIDTSKLGSGFGLIEDAKGYVL